MDTDEIDIRWAVALGAAIRFGMTVNLPSSPDDVLADIEKTHPAEVAELRSRQAALLRARAQKQAFIRRFPSGVLPDEPSRQEYIRLDLAQTAAERLLRDFIRPTGK